MMLVARSPGLLRVRSMLRLWQMVVQRLFILRGLRELHQSRVLLERHGRGEQIGRCGGVDIRVANADTAQGIDARFSSCTAQHRQRCSGGRCRSRSRRGTRGGGVAMLQSMAAAAVRVDVALIRAGGATTADESSAALRGERGARGRVVVVLRVLLLRCYRVVRSRPRSLHVVQAISRLLLLCQREQRWCGM